MSDARPFGWLVLAGAAVGLLAVLSNRLSERTRVPTPAFFLVGAAVAAGLAPHLHALPHRTVERLVTAALVVILFDGGMHIGRARFRSVAGAVASVGVLGTFATTVAIALLAHYALGFEWWIALLVGTAIAPTDPAVVLSVLGKREVAGRSGTLLEGESGANDPVGIALMSALLAAGGVSAGALGHVAGELALQMVVGAVAGIAGGAALLWFMRRVPLPSEGLYPLRTLAGAMAVFGAATVAHGSGFLAVFVAGILLGDEAAPYKREIVRFHGALASLGEIVAFVLLGLSVDVGALAHRDVLVPGLVLAAALALVVRPLVVGLCLLPVELGRGERAFVLWAGLKGAVPILLGSFLLSAGVPDAERLYGVVVVVVALSVLVQGSLVPAAARLLRVPMRTVEPEPWALGVRLRDEPQGVHRFAVALGSPADGTTVADLSGISDDVWVAFVIRAGELVHVRGSTQLRAGDEVLLLGDPGLHDELVAAFGQPAG
ncbi:MAG: cation:proton antiporter [Frankiaceae bacterium]